MSEVKQEKKKFISETTSKVKENSEIQRIKSYLREEDLVYVSENIRDLLTLTIKNNEEGFKRRLNNRKKIDQYQVTLYIRLSVEDGDVMDGDVSKSIRNQLLILLDECKKRNWMVVGIFCEEGISGVNDKRPEWNKLLIFCQYRNTQIVLCKSQSRFSRSMEMIEKYLHNEFVTWNIRFVGLVDNTDTFSIGNKKTRQINGLVNEWQVEDQSINIRAVLKNKQSNGLFTGAFAPYGYKKDPQDKYHFEVDEEAANVVRTIFTMYAKGQGVVKICHDLNKKKIPIPSLYKYQKGSKYHCSKIELNKKITYQVEKGDTLRKIADQYQSTIKEIKEYNLLKSQEIKEGQILIIPIVPVWKTNTIYQILKNPVYIGTLVQHKNEIISYKNKKERSVPKEQRIVVPHCHTAIIDEGTWNMVCSRFEKKQKTRSGKNGKISIFSGKVKCSACGHTFHKDFKIQGNKTYQYWVCGNRYRSACFLCSNSKAIKEEEIDQLIKEEINKQIKKYYDQAKIQEQYEKQKVSESLEQKEQQIKKEKKELERAIVKKEAIITLLYEDRASGIMDLEEFTNRYYKCHDEKKKEEEKLIQKEKQLSLLNKQKRQKTNIDKKLEKYKKIETLNRMIMDEFISKIYIGYYQPNSNTRKIRIIWNP